MMPEWLYRVPEPWDMVIAWVLYIGIVALGFMLTMLVVWAIQ